MPDTYANFQELANVHTADVDYDIVVVDDGRDPEIAVIAPHGGRIEPHTDIIAEALAGTDWVYYAFCGKKRRGNRRLHITSHHFDEPTALRLVKQATLAIAVHGKAGSRPYAMIGGRNDELRLRVEGAISDLGFDTRPPTTGLGGTDSCNICNRCGSGAGVQLELSRGLREELVREEALMQRFAATVRREVREHMQAEEV